MRNTVERRQMILKIICERKADKIDNLAFEFSVCRNTIKKDIEVLSMSFPIYTTQGNGGGVHIVDGFKLEMKYLDLNLKSLLVIYRKNKMIYNQAK